MATKKKTTTTEPATVSKSAVTTLIAKTRANEIELELDCLPGEKIIVRKTVPLSEYLDAIKTLVNLQVSAEGKRIHGVRDLASDIVFIGTFTNIPIPTDLEDAYTLCTLSDLAPTLQYSRCPQFAQIVATANDVLFDLEIKSQKPAATELIDGVSNLLASLLGSAGGDEPTASAMGIYLPDAPAADPVAGVTTTAALEV
jgi:hypothetical protein